MVTNTRPGGLFNIRWALVGYDGVIYALTYMFMYIVYANLGVPGVMNNIILSTLGFLCLFACRLFGHVYHMIIRYGGVQCYLRLFITDTLAGLLFILVNNVLPIAQVHPRRVLIITCLNLLGALFIRLFYRYSFRNATKLTAKGQMLRTILAVFAGAKVIKEKEESEE